MTPIFPMVFASQEVFLLTALGLGFLFGFALERAGFGNARKLAAQFYLYDMTVFKVMFTAIIVAMVGLYSLAGIGLVDLSILWINPTFLWAQVIGGFLLGMGFLMSGLCPGTSVVSAVSGRYDGAVTLAGIFVGTALFAVAVDVFPAIAHLYEAGGEISLLPALLGLPTPAVVLVVVVIAAGGFIGAEWVERVFAEKHGTIELTPVPTRRTPIFKFVIGGALATVVLVSAAWKAPAPDPTPSVMSAIDPLDLAEAIIAGDPNVMIFDLRSDRTGPGIPGAFAVDDSAAAPLLTGLAPTVQVVVYDETGERRTAPGSWPAGVSYRYVRDGFAGWKATVMTPAAPESYSLADRERAQRQNQIAAYFSGTAASAAAAPPPPPAMTSGANTGQKRKGGC